MKNMRYETCKVVLFFLLLTMLNPTGLAYANEYNGEVLDGKELVAKESKPESSGANNQKYIADLKNKYEALKNRINDLESQAEGTKSPS